jgi:hypothetical protein
VLYAMRILSKKEEHGIDAYLEEQFPWHGMIFSIAFFTLLVCEVANPPHKF